MTLDTWSLLVKTLPPSRISFASERIMASASVKAMVHQYYHGRDRDRLKEKSRLETVEDASERIREDEESSKAEYYDRMVASDQNDDQQMSEEENLGKRTASERGIESSSLSLASDLAGSKSTSVKMTRASANKSASSDSNSNRFYTSKDIRPLTVPFEVRVGRPFTVETPSSDDQHSGQRKSFYSLYSEKPEEDTMSGTNNYSQVNKNGTEKEEGQEENSEKDEEEKKEDEEEEHDDDRDVETGSQNYYSTGYNPTQDSGSKSNRRTSEGEGESEKPDEKRPADHHKALSDIYPVSRRHPLTNRQHDMVIDLAQLNTKSVELDYKKRQRKQRNELSDSSAAASNDSSVNLDEFDNEKLKKQFDHKVDLVPTRTKIVQANHYDIDKEARRTLASKMAKRVDLTDLITEQLMKCALLAGSTDNIVVNCILLPGSNF